MYRKQTEGHGADELADADGTRHGDEREKSEMSDSSETKAERQVQTKSARRFLFFRDVSQSAFLATALLLHEMRCTVDTPLQSWAECLLIHSLLDFE